MKNGNRVALYSRVSSTLQVMRGKSLADQELDLRDWAKRNGRTVFNEYVESGVTGAKRDRPQLNRLLADAKHGYFASVVIPKFDRLGRSLRDTLNIHHELKELGINIISADEGIDTGTPDGIQRMQMFSLFAQYEHDRIGQRVKDFRGRSKQGQWTAGRTPFGYRFDKATKKLGIYEPEADAIRFAFTTYTRSQGMGIIRLAMIMNAEHLPTPRMGRRKDTTWTDSTLQHVLHHPSYFGGPNELWPFETPAIIDRELWEKAQERLIANRRFKPSNQSHAKFKGKLRCGLCGHMLRIGYSHNTTAFYECPGRLARTHLDGSDRCTLPRFNAKELDSKVSLVVMDAFSTPNAIKRTLKNTIESLKAQRDSLARDISPIDAEMNQLRNEMAMLDAKADMGRITPSQYRSSMKSMQEREMKLMAKRRGADPELERQIIDIEATIKINESWFRAWTASPMEAGEAVYEAIKDITELARQTDDGTIMDKFPLLPDGALIGEPMADKLDRFNMVGVVYPDRIELKGSVRQSDSASAYRSDMSLPLMLTVSL